MEVQAWQRTKQAFKATARFVKFLPLIAGLTVYGCSSCQKGVEDMGNGSTITKFAEDDPKAKKTAQKDSLDVKKDTAFVAGKDTIQAPPGNAFLRDPNRKLTKEEIEDANRPVSKKSQRKLEPEDVYTPMPKK